MTITSPGYLRIDFLFHHYHAGKYLFTEVSNNKAAGSVTRFETTYLPPGDKCVRFNRNMFGEHIGRLSVVGFNSNSGRGTTFAEFTKDGGSGRLCRSISLVYISEHALRHDARG